MFRIYVGDNWCLFNYIELIWIKEFHKYTEKKVANELNEKFDFNGLFKFKSCSIRFLFWKSRGILLQTFLVQSLLTPVYSFFTLIRVGFIAKNMSKINKLSIRGIRSFGTSKEDEQVSKITNEVFGFCFQLNFVHRKLFSLLHWLWLLEKMAVARQQSLNVWNMDWRVKFHLDQTEENCLFTIQKFLDPETPVMHKWNLR